MLTIEESAKPLIKKWLAIGVTALALAGVFAVILVVARTPGLNTLPFFKELFAVSLVVHVDLSVWVWFLAIICLSFTLLPGVAKAAPLYQKASYLLFGFGALAMALSPLHSEWVVYKSNYIPMLHNPVFVLSLALLMCGLMVQLLALALWFIQRPALSLIQQGIALNGVILFIALGAFIASAALLKTPLEGVSLYEHLFWGGGHVLQFGFVQIMMVAWMTLLCGAGLSLCIPNVMQRIIFWFGPVVLLATPYAYIAYDITDYEHQKFFTWQMNIVGGAAAVLLSIYTLAALFEKWSQRSKANRAYLSSLLMSLLLFLSGGLISLFIQGQNVIIPAHYHGSIVGVTLALMGFVYWLLPRLGYKDMSQSRTAFWQPIVLGGGQLLHIGGLAVSGGYGVLRKVAGGTAELEPHVRAALGVMGGGGLLAIIGGLMFVIVVIQSVRKKGIAHSKDK